MKIPEKNLRKVAGRSLIEHAARTARSPALDRLQRAQHRDESSPTRAALGSASRSGGPWLAGDLSPTVDAWCHAWLASKPTIRRFDLSLLSITTPLRRLETWSARCACRRSGHRAAATVSRVPGHCAERSWLDVSGYSFCWARCASRGAPGDSRLLLPQWRLLRGLRETVVDDRQIWAWLRRRAIEADREHRRA
jgi:hypothetical protein